MNNARGFTLIEILLVVIIIGILVSLVAPRLAGRSEEARKQAAHADIEGGISLALDLFEVGCINRHSSALTFACASGSEQCQVV